MTIDCGSCGARYNIQDSLIPPQGARVKCKKCATMISVPPPPVMELEPQDIELIPPSAPEPPPAPEPPAVREEAPVSTSAFGSGFDSAAEPSLAPTLRTPSDTPSEQFPEDGPPEPPPAEDEFERAGAPPRFGSPPAFSEPSGVSHGSTMTIEPITASPAVDETEPASTVSAPSSGAAGAAPAPSRAESSPVRGGSPLPSGLSPEERSAHEKARRLARVLASDISIYNREKKERGIREGNLVAMLGYEIKKSWEIYKERVGPEFANSTPYFRDALNEMLADGKKIF